jgi:OHCU decarboxylase
MVSKRPFASATEVLQTGDDVWYSLREQDWLEAFSGHPKIGDSESLKKKFLSTSEWAMGEQSGVTGATDDVSRNLLEGNRRYEKKFGFIFIVCATGKSAMDMLELLAQRLGNERGEELRIAAGEQSKITRLRLEKLLVKHKTEEPERIIHVVQAVTEMQINMAREMFVEYAKSLNIDLCFQNFDKEVNGLPGEYALPRGRLLLASFDSKVAGCVALKRISDEVCEMKRLYVRSEFRGKGIGKRLTTDVMEQARVIGYKQMRLDTLPSMKEAIALYRSLGFESIAPFRDLPASGALFMQARLR